MPKIISGRNGGTLIIPEKGDPSTNPNGRPKSSIRKVNDTLLSQGHTPVTKSDIEETFRLLTGLTEASLSGLVKDKENPILIRTVANYLIKDWKNNGIGPIEKVLDRAIGTDPATVNNILVLTQEEREKLSFLNAMAPQLGTSSKQ